MRSVSPTAPRQRTTARLLALEILLFLLFLGVLVTMESAFARQKAELLRQQAVLDALEAALDSCQDAADVLENVAIKHA